ncbi:MAG TPA: glutathione S-transferase family protein [Casimicrobiaceae bacterium]|nr:glutathione S-transferase family protein [Casimicrobiaceae bacterium]
MYTLYIGNKNYSTWSLRSWVLMKTAGIPFREQRLALYEAGSSARIRAHSPSAKVPCLHDGTMVVWDSMAIAEYLAERHPGLWPADREARAWARSAAAEMHSGFSKLRNELGMNLRLRETRVASPAVAAEIERITEIWRDGRQRFGEGGGFLCGSFGIVDAFYCPVAFRFHCYAVALTGECAAYHRRLMALPAMQEWLADAMRESEHIAEFDARPAQGQQQ